MSHRIPPDAKALLPPIPLYRQILRTHRLLPPQMRILGDDYVKAEFRRHRDVDNPVYIVGFLSQWQDYLDTMKVQTGPMAEVVAAAEEAAAVNAGEGSAESPAILGRKLDSVLLDKLNDQQIGQLYELREEVKRFKNGQVPGADDDISASPAPAPALGTKA
ncbi:hypothetical protein BC937DRAFT_89402 [Endogone sp. FLAS-F59071]|nr:hypothetical protein BC937DRAFT_89402 [Endogone sp. FLAS-F59071]|eukprot:RUS17867.1 hypothetical protein BC937DRAFT_89402 [Endogone sp. FLAS-F59071]